MIKISQFFSLLLEEKEANSLSDVVEGMKGGSSMSKTTGYLG